MNKITAIPENEAGYPEFSMFGELPSWGMYIRHAEGIKLINFKIAYKEDDFRPAFVIDDVKGINLQEVHINSAKEMPVILFNKTSDVNIKNLQMPVTPEVGIQRTNY